MKNLKVEYSKVIEFSLQLWYNLLRLLRKIGGVIIKRLTTKRKKWLEIRSKRIIKKRRKLNNKTKKYGKRVINHNSEYKAIAPNIFSIIENTESVIGYFNDIIEEIKKCRFREKFYFDFSQVEYLSIDALMYILAILRNIKSTSIYQYDFLGNRPNNTNARKLFDESGFYNYVGTRQKDIKSNTNKIQILTGDIVDTKVSALICDFINDRCKTKRHFTRDIYELIIELMTNTVQHAYKEKEVLFVCNWYIFVEDREDTINFIFLDTGEGIPRTIRKKLREKILPTSDSKLILSAIKGENRSETKSLNRGKGLPSIAKDSLESVYENLQVYSGCGVCKISREDNSIYQLTDIKETFVGTLFSWEIDKSKIEGKYKA